MRFIQRVPFQGKRNKIRKEGCGNCCSTNRCGDRYQVTSAAECRDSVKNNRSRVFLASANNKNLPISPFVDPVYTLFINLFYLSAYVHLLSPLVEDNAFCRRHF